MEDLSREDKVVKIKLLLAEFFNGDEDKVKFWLNTKNPSFGYISPNNLIARGRIDKVIEFIQMAKEENGW